MKKYVLLTLVTMLTMGCASTETQDSTGLETNGTAEQQSSVLDSYNRTMHDFNQGVHEYVLYPVGSALDFVTPDIVQDAMFSMLDNLSEPNTAINNLLQGKVAAAGQDLGRFGINTTLGLLGIIDWASMMGLEKHEEDFGQTLAYWGVEDGGYFVLPVMGGVTPLGLVGAAVSYDPINSSTKSAKNAVDNLGYADMLLSSTEFETLPDYDKSKQMYLAFRHCASEDGAETAQASCAIVCDNMQQQMQKELAQAESPEQRAEMQAMSHTMLPGFCQSSAIENTKATAEAGK